MWNTVSIVMSYVWVFCKPIMVSLIAMMTKEALEIVYEVVVALSETDLTNEEKRKEAFTQIKYLLKQRGLELKDSIIYLLIELAVTRLKEKK